MCNSAGDPAVASATLLPFRQMVEGSRLTIVEWSRFLQGLNKVILGLGGRLETTITIMDLSSDLRSRSVETADNFEEKKGQ